MKNTKVISIVELKKRVANTSIFGIIISKFCHRKKPYLVILFEIDKGLKVDFYYTILSFNLTIYLWIEGNKKFLLDVKEIV